MRHKYFLYLLLLFLGSEGLLASIDLIHNMENRPVARQFLYSLKRYVNSAAFAPEETLNESLIDEFFK